jgi:hypothetical protein
MRQQINLYQPIFSHKRKQLSAATVATALGVIVTMLIGICLYANQRVNALAREVEAMRERAAQQQSIMAQAGELQAARGNPVEINARVKHLSESVAARSKALKILQDGAAGQTTGFASRMEALARRHVEGLWIDGLMLSGTTGSMTLQGASLDADTVPTYLQGLAQERALTGTRFDDFVIERPGRAPRSIAASDTEEGSAVPQPRPAAPTNHIRFRAGSKSLASTPTEATT